jgi:hypothetical protein
MNTSNKIRYNITSCVEKIQNTLQDLLIVLQSFSSINPKMRENSQEKVNGWLGEQEQEDGVKFQQHNSSKR